MRSFFFLLLVLGATAVAHATPVEVRDLRLWAGPDSTRVVLDLSAEVRYEVFTLSGPDRVVIDLQNASLDQERVRLPAGSGLVSQLRVGARDGGTLRIVLDLTARAEPKDFLATPNDVYGHRLVVDLASGTTPRPVKAPHAPTGQRDLVIAVDAGHGGEDPGAIGKRGTREKDVTLQVARRLAERIDAEPGMRAVLIRTGDYFVPLRERSRRARLNQADMFISIHADAYVSRDVRGSSVYVLSSRGASDEAARWLAAKENSADLIGGVSLDDKNDVLASVLLDLSQNAAISASREAAGHVLSELDTVGRLKKSGVQHAGFVVLKSPDIPSMLVETAFISNMEEEQRLRDPDYQRRLAAAIHKGVRTYYYDNPPSGTHIAQLAAQARGRPLRHVIAAGESLYDVAGRYSVSVESLRRTNNLADDRPASGTVLEIPFATGG